MRLDGKIAAITGAGSGIGLSSATLFAKKEQRFTFSKSMKIVEKRSKNK